MKKKKKVPTLPANILPVIPDLFSGIGRFNANANVSLGESMNNINMDKLRMEITTATIDYMIDIGLDESEATLSTDVDIASNEDSAVITLSTGLGLDDKNELISILSSILDTYNVNFDIKLLDYGDIEITISSKEDETLYEATQQKLSAQDKNKLAKFIEKTDDVEEIKTFFNGLKNKDKQNISEELEAGEMYDKLPRDIQIYLDEFDGPWIDYGENEDGEIFYSDMYDTYTWDTLEDFIRDMRYNINEIAKDYREDATQFDYSDEFINILNSIELNESMNLYENDLSSSPFWLDERDELEFDFDQRIRFYSDDPADWEFSPFEEDFNKYSTYGIELTDTSIYTPDKDELAEILLSVLSNKTKLGATNLPGDFRVTGTVLVPYEVDGLEKYPTYVAQDEFDYTEYEYDTQNVTITWDDENARIIDYHIERIS